MEELTLLHTNRDLTPIDAHAPTARWLGSVEEYVRLLFSDLRALFCRHRRRIGIRQPLEMFEQLCSLDAERHCKVFWRMELIPVSIGGKAPQLVAQDLDRTPIFSS